VTYSRGRPTVKQGQQVSELGANLRFEYCGKLSRKWERVLNQDVVPPARMLRGWGIHSLQQLELQADPELAIGFINGADRLDPMATEVMSGFLEVSFRTGERAKCTFDLRMSSHGWGW